MFLLGLLAALLMGMVLGLLGAGGSILTVPILIYGFGFSSSIATSYSLLVVGVVAAISAIRFYLKKQLDFKSAFLFVIPSLIGVSLARNFLLMLIPQRFSLFGMALLEKDDFILFVFSLVMLASAFSMIKNEKKLKSATLERSVFFKSFWVSVLGLAVGVVTGFVGAGGGFLILPVLIHFLKIDIKKAIGTSLFIISVNALVGFAISSYQGLPGQYFIIFAILVISILGSYIGAYFSDRINEVKLKKMFGYFVFLVGISIFVSKMS